MPDADATTTTTVGVLCVEIYLNDKQDLLAAAEPDVGPKALSKRSRRHPRDRRCYMRI